MSQQVYIRLHPGDPRAHVTFWHPGSSEKAPRRGHGPIGTVAEQLGSLPAVFLVPTQEVLLTRVQLPLRNRSRLRRAVPYALEEQLAEDVDHLHFALAEPDGDRQQGIPVAVVSRESMNEWLAAARESGMLIEGLIPDVLALPRESARWSLLIEPEGALLRYGRTAGLAIDLQNTEAVVRRLVAGSDPLPDGLDIYEPAGGPSVPEAVAGVLPDVRRHAYDEELDWLAPETTADMPVDLCQGDYVVDQGRESLWRRWRPAATVAAVVLALQVGLDVIDLARLSSRNQALEERRREVFQETFPSVERIVDMPTQARQKLAELRRQAGQSGGDLLEILAAFGAAVEGSSQLRVNGINYQGSGVELQVLADGVERLETIQSRVGQDDLSLEIRSVNNRSEGIEARLQIERPSS